MFFAIIALRKHPRTSCSALVAKVTVRCFEGRGYAVVSEGIFPAVCTSCRKIKFGIGVHDLRQIYKTLALAASVNLETLSSMMGHATITLTANTYLLASDSLQRDAAERIDAILGPEVADDNDGFGRVRFGTGGPTRRTI